MLAGSVLGGLISGGHKEVQGWLGAAPVVSLLW